MAPVREAYWSGDYHGAWRQLEEVRSDYPDDKHLYDMELAVVANAIADPKAAVAALREARDRLDELGGRGFFESFSAMMLDDRSLDYEGADYEHVLVRAMLALSDLMGDGKDALAYSLQVLERQQEIMDAFEDANGERPKHDYKLVAFGSYVRAIILDENPRDRRTAAREFRRVVEMEPGFRDGKADLERAERGWHCDKGNGVVHVLALVGRGPFRVEVEERASAEALALAQIIWNHHHEDRPVLANLNSIPIPALAFHENNPDAVHVAVNGQELGTTATITNVDEVASAEFAAMHKYIMARAVLRRMLKIMIVEAGKEAVEQSGEDAHEKYGWQLLIDLFGLIWTASERADLRCWSLLPQTFQAVRLELPAGDHELVLRAGQGGHPTGAPQRVHVHVRDGYNTYVLVLAPTLQGGPPPLTSRPAQPVKPAQPAQPVKPAQPAKPAHDDTPTTQP
ncbi:MAG: COG3014 family protein, partial [Planctomycetota bacterium]